MQPQPGRRADTDRSPLRLASDPPPTPEAEPVAQPEPIPAPERRVYATIAEHLTDRAMVIANPENHLIAALLNANHADAAAVLALVEDDDLQHYLPAVVLGLIRRLVDAGQEPTPQEVIARARGPLDIAPRPSLRSVVLYVAEVFTMGMPVRPWAAACDVVEDAYRRSFSEVGTRVAQMAEAFADVEELEEEYGAARRRWLAHRQRLHELRRRAVEIPEADPGPRPTPPGAAAGAGANAAHLDAEDCCAVAVEAPRLVSVAVVPSG
uniref:hypothetical protein n=1 Tax=Nocardia abscessus TaxID=120957 RepID=UPI00245459B2